MEIRRNPGDFTKVTTVTKRTGNDEIPRKDLIPRKQAAGVGRAVRTDPEARRGSICSMGSPQHRQDPRWKLEAQRANRTVSSAFSGLVLQWECDSDQGETHDTPCSGGREHGQGQECGVCTPR